MDWKQFFIDIRKSRGKSPSFNTAILESSDWFLRTVDSDMPLLDREQDELPIEKVQIIKAITDFAVKKTPQTAKKVVKQEIEKTPLSQFERIKMELEGNKKVVATSALGHEVKDNFQDIQKYTQRSSKGVSYKIEDEVKNSLTDLTNIENVSVIFIGDTFTKESGEEDLLGKMIQAMNLPEDSYKRFYFADEFNDEEYLFSMLNEILLIKPQFVIPLGAKSSMLLLQKKDRLSKIHGKFFPIEIVGLSDKDQFQTEVCPVFHPDFLRINPSMKRMAWIDLQKIMKRLTQDT